MNRRMLPLLLVVALPLLGLVAACGENSAGSATTESTKRTVDAVTIQVMEIAPGDFSETLQLTGTIASFEDVKVPADEGGRVLRWLVPRGANVRAGQVLVQLDSALLRTAYDAALAQYNIAQTNYEKQKRVFEQQGISELQLKTLEYQRDAAKAGMEMNRERLERTRVKSPINGTLNIRFVEAGEMIGPGVPIAHVVNNGRLKIEAGVPERYAGSFKVGDRVRFTVDAFPGDEFSGSVSFVGAAVSQDNRTIPIEVLVSGGGKLKPDMIAAMSITLSAKSGVISIHDDYIVKKDIDQFVAYVMEDGLARERALELGSSNKGTVVIRKGLNPGDKLITLGVQNVADGQPVKVKN